MATFLGILRPAGDLGDELDATSLQGSSVKGGFAVPVTPVELGDLTVAPQAIDFVRFYMRVGWYPEGVGPDTALAWMSWRVGAGIYGVSDYEMPPEGVGAYSDFVSLDQDTAPGLISWTLQAVNDLQMRTGWYADDAGSGLISYGNVAEVWAEVWGTPAGSTTEGVAVGSGTAGVAVGAGEVTTTVNADGTAAVAVGEGEVTTTVNADGTAAVAVGAGWV